MTTVYFLCGLPSSGKTTFAKKLEIEKDAIRFTLDERMIEKYHYSIFDDEYGVLVTKEKLIIWEEAQILLGQGKDVILDWSLWSRAARTEWTQKAIESGHEYKLFYFDVPLEMLLRRLGRRNLENRATIHTIPIEEVERFSKIFEPPTRAENLNLVIMTVEKEV